MSIKMQKTKQSKKKLVQNFQFDPNDVINVDGYQIITARSILLNELFTLKRINLNDPENQIRHQIMLRQISMLKSFNGINIIKCHKILKSKSHLYLVYDFCTGKTLADIISKNAKLMSDGIKIDQIMSLKLKEDYVDIRMIEMIGKQLCQVLKQIQSRKIVHMLFNPLNMIVLKNNLLKMNNFIYSQDLEEKQEGELSQKMEINQYSDPFLKQTGHFSYYTDIYSFGKTLDKLYLIYKASQKFKPKPQLEQLVKKMTLYNPYERIHLDEVYQFFFSPKNDLQTAKQLTFKSINSKQLIFNSLNPKQLISKLQNAKQSSKNQSEASKLRDYPQNKKNLRKSFNELRYRPPVDSINRSRAQILDKSKSVILSQNKQRKKKEDHSPTNQSQHNYRSPQSVEDLVENNKIITKTILKKRNFAMLLLQVADIIGNKIQGQSNLSLQLVFLLYKKSLIQVVALAKFLSKGNKKYIPQISESYRIKFTKIQDYYLLSKIINQQLQQQRNMLVLVASLIKKQCPLLVQQGANSKSNSILQVKTSRLATHIPDLSDFQKQINYQTLNNDFFITIIYKYLKMYCSDLMVLNQTNPNVRQILYFLNVLLQILNSQSYEGFVKNYFSISFNNSASFLKQNSSSKAVSLKNLLRMSPRLVNLQNMTADQLEEQLKNGLQKFQ